MTAIIITTDVFGQVETYTYGGESKQEFCEGLAYFKSVKHSQKHLGKDYPILDCLFKVLEKENALSTERV